MTCMGCERLGFNFLLFLKGFKAISSSLLLGEHGYIQRGCSSTAVPPPFSEWHMPWEPLGTFFKVPKVDENPTSFLPFPSSAAAAFPAVLGTGKLKNHFCPFQSGWAGSRLNWDTDSSSSNAGPGELPLSVPALRVTW